MSVYLGYDTVTKQYLKSLAGGPTGGRGGGSGGTSVSTNSFTMFGDINMGGNEVVGLDVPSTDSSATNKKYVNDKVTTVGGISQAQADATYLKKTDATTTYETQTSASNTYLSKTDATSTYALIGASWTKAESDAKYSTSEAGGLSATGFTMTGDIDLNYHEIKRFLTPTANKSATNKEYVDNNFLSLHGGTLLGNVSMSGQSITDLNPTPQNNNDAVTKSYVDNSISLAGGLSISGITMQGDIDMQGHEVKGLADPTNDNMAASKGFAESNFLDLAGGTMVGNVSMDSKDIANLPDTPPTDNSATSKKYVDDEIAKVPSGGGGASTSGFSMTGNINMQQNEVLRLPDTPSQDHSAVSKKYVKDNFVESSGDTMAGNLNMGGHSITNIGVPTTNTELANKKYVDDEVTKAKSHGSTNALQKSGGTMTGDINMGGFEVIGVTSVPSFNNSLVNKKYVDDEITAVSGGISQAQPDARYLRLTKYEYDNWMDTFIDMNDIAIVWSDHVRKSVIDSNTNLEIRTI